MFWLWTVDNMCMSMCMCACMSICMCAYVSGGEICLAETDSDSGKGTIASYDSSNSLNAVAGAGGGGMSGSQTLGGSQTPLGEDLGQFEVRKQQKDIWENGIEM